MLQPLDLLVQNLKAVTYLVTLNRSVTGEVSRGDPLQEHPEDMLVVPLPGGNPGCSHPITGPAVPSAPATALTDTIAAAAPFAKRSGLPSHATSGHGCPCSRLSTAAATRALPAAALAPGGTPSATYLGQQPQPARRVCGGRRRRRLLRFTLPSLNQSHPSPAASAPPSRTSPRPLPAPSPCGRRGGAQLLQHGLGQQLPLLRGEGGGGRAVSRPRDGRPPHRRPQGPPYLLLGEEPLAPPPLLLQQLPVPAGWGGAGGAVRATA